MQPGQRLTQWTAMRHMYAARPDAWQKGGNGSVPAAQHTQRLAVSAGHRQRAIQPLRGQMLHQAQEPGQVVRIHALFVQRQNEIAVRRAQREVAVLHALRDAAKRHQIADPVLRQESAQVFI